MEGREKTEGLGHFGKNVCTGFVILERMVSVKRRGHCHSFCVSLFLANYRFTNSDQFVEMTTIINIQILHFSFHFPKGMSVQIGRQADDGCQMLLQNGCYIEGHPTPALVHSKVFLNCNQEVQTTIAINSHTIAINPGQQNADASCRSEHGYCRLLCIFKLDCT